MSKTPLYKMLQDVPSSGGWTLATLLDGSVSGSQLLLQAGKPVWQAGPRGGTTHDSMMSSRMQS